LLTLIPHFSKDQAMFRFRHIIAALILVAASAASLNSVGARVVHPIVFSPSAAAAAPASDGRRLFAAAGHDQLMALCQQVERSLARARTHTHEAL